MIVDDLIEHCPFCGSNDLMVGNHQKSPGTWLGLVVESQFLQRKQGQVLPEA